MHPAIAGLQSFGDHKGPLHLAAKRMRAAKNLKRHAIHGKAGTSTLPIVAVKRLPFQFKPLSLNPIIKKADAWRLPSLPSRRVGICTQR